MAKSCAMCGKTLGVFANKAELRDGFMCEKCLKLGGMNCNDTFNVTAKVLIERIKTHVEMKKTFHTTKDCGQLKLDMKSHIFKLRDDYYPFSKLITYSYREDPENQRISQHDGKAGGAVVGGIIGGLGGGFVGRAVGASVGAALGNKVGGLFSSVCNYMYISVTIDDADNPKDKIYFIREKTRVSSDEYRRALEEARDLLEGLDIISHYNSEEHRNEELYQQHERAMAENEKTVFVQNGHMSAEQVNRELTAYMTMKESGLITEDEYNEKKKQLLSMK